MEIDSETGTARQKKEDEVEEASREAHPEVKGESDVADLSGGVEEEGLFAKKRISKVRFKDKILDSAAQPAYLSVSYFLLYVRACDRVY